MGHALLLASDVKGNISSSSSTTAANARMLTTQSRQSAYRIVPDYVTRNAPLIWLHSEDPFRPSDLLEHIQHTTPRIDRDRIPDLPPLDLDSLELLNNVSNGTSRVALTSNDDVTTWPSWILGQTPDPSGRIANATACIVILVEKSARDLDAFYFYFYSYDRGPNITQVMEPLNRLIEDDGGGMHFGDHVGDWEHNMVRFHDGKPTGIYYSQHVDGSAFDWNDNGLTIQDDRPLVFSAYGSHANYESPGEHVHDSALIDYCDAGQLWDPMLSANFYQLDPDAFALSRLALADADDASEANQTSFFYFKGRWGDIQYPDTDPRQKTVPHFGLKRFVTGPQGPIVKQLVRKDLFPDRRHKKPWVQWAVGIFMSWYPCCVRGWRIWMSATVVVVGILVMALCVRLGVKRLRQKQTGYKRIDTEIPLNDMTMVDRQGRYREEESIG
ncbi:uncharacterized protein J7T54_004203 [Emericellopsis cladophorae]|uniref:Vacuolar protein sorting-associated protein 62 n=1 Tax=Emericellopsis cladophorae TaxID=2686198 RepID=A0A9P9XY72_9HYPO|nr:uncharacterized protein J7T54_004203 [Emericellopsis cladophorae]KAI6780071.1 hypothetical protein J7T54_004203 [Emericellopsis cladophorae]